MYDYQYDPSISDQEKQAIQEESLGSLSRAERIEVAEEESGEGLLKSPHIFFDFSRDANDGKIYGIDVSHHQNDIDWKKVSDAGAKFCYVKASQGVTIVDRNFTKNIESSIENGIPTGAYHFLSSLTPADHQADNFIREYSPWHVKCELPPVVDIEWDRKNRHSPDRWQNKSPEVIVEMSQVLLERVEQEFAIRPLIYTNKKWWESRIGDLGNVLSKYPLWPSRYGAFDSSAPPLMEGFDWLLWQFTDHGTINGVEGKVDVNWCKPEFIIR